MSSLEYIPFVDLVQEVGEIVQDTGPDRAVLIKRALNFSLRQAARRDEWIELFKSIRSNTGSTKLPKFWTTAALEALQQPGILPAATSTDMPIYVSAGYQALGTDMAKVYDLRYGFTDETNTYPIREVDQEEFSTRVSVNPVLTGEPAIWTRSGVTPMPWPLLKRSTLKVVSDSMGDTGVVRIVGEVFVAASDEQNQSESQLTVESITLNGMTAVASSNQYMDGWSIRSIIIDSSNTGTITVTAHNNDANNAVKMFVSKPYSLTSGDTGWDRVIERPLIQVWPIPVSRYPMSATYKMNVPPLANDMDIPLLPISNYLIEMAASRIFENMRRHDVAQVHKQNAEKAMIEIIGERRNSQLTVASPDAARYRIRSSRH